MHFQTLQSGPRSVITGENRATCCEKGQGALGATLERLGSQKACRFLQTGRFSSPPAATKGRMRSMRSLPPSISAKNPRLLNQRSRFVSRLPSDYIIPRCHFFLRLDVLGLGKLPVGQCG